MVKNVGASAHPRGIAYTKDMDDAYAWLVKVKGQASERFDVSLDDSRGIEKREQEAGRSMSTLANSENGFQLVCGKKEKGGSLLESGKEVEPDSSSASVVKMVTEDMITTVPKLKVPFHIPTIRRPQDEYSIIVNNSNQPFEHVWLQRTDDGQKFLHPLEKLSALDFVDKDCGHVEPIKPPSIDCTPFQVVKDVKDLKELAAKLRAVKEFAVDLEHNQYRSFQGLTCLMQISTRTEDFAIDTLKLRIHVGPYLREVFKDPAKRKVMHGADRDVLWLQRDFGIYICNLFDTGQASRVLKLERNSLEYLLHHYCGVTANKEYQHADWRLRPLPNQMLRYARDDTHYLLYIYDLMRMKLLGLSKDPQNSDNPLLEVYKLSYDVCMQLYEKELLTENSFLYIYGLQGAGLNAQQLAVVSGLYEWRDIVARAEDESTGYVLPNKTLLEIAKQMPVTKGKLQKLIKSRHPYVEHNYDSIVSIIIHSLQNASAFEAAAQKLEEERVTAFATRTKVESEITGRYLDGLWLSIELCDACRHWVGDIHNDYRTEAPLPKMPNSNIANARKESIGFESAKSPFSFAQKMDTLQHQNKSGQLKFESNSPTSEFPHEKLNISQKNKGINAGISSTATVYGANGQVLKKPSRAFDADAPLEDSTSKGKADPGKGKEKVKPEQIRFSVNLPLHSFLVSNDQSRLVIETPSIAHKTSMAQTHAHNPGSMRCNNQENTNQLRERSFASNISVKEERDEPMSLSKLSLKFEGCFHPNKQNKSRLS